MKRERYSSTLIGTFEFLFSIMDRITRQKISKRVENLYKTTSHLVLTDIYRPFHQNNRKHILLKCVGDTWYKVPYPTSAAAAAKLLQSCPNLCDPIEPTRLPRPWDSPGKNTGVGCHFLLQCMEVESESEVTQSFPTLSDPMVCSPPGSSIHGIFQAGVLKWGATFNHS